MLQDYFYSTVICLVKQPHYWIQIIPTKLSYPGSHGPKRSGGVPGIKFKNRPSTTRNVPFGTNNKSDRRDGKGC